MRRLLSCFVAVLMTLALPGLLPGGVMLSAAAAQDGTTDWQPDPEEQWLFDLRTDRFSLGEGVRGYARGTVNCVDLGDMIRALDLPLRLDRQLRRATGWVFDERRTLVIDREAGRVEVASAVYRLAPGDIVDTPEGWCVRSDRLAEWIGVALDVDLSNSIIRLRSERPLPFEIAAERRARAGRIRPGATVDFAALPRADRPYQLWQVPSVDVIATAAVRSDGQGNREARLRYELFASGELLGASFDARVSSDDRGVPEAVRISAYRSDPDGRLLGPLRATHFGIGDVTSMMTPIGLETAVGRGAILSNQPLDRPAAFDRTSFRGNLPAGWEAELYRNGQLLAFTGADAAGRYEFSDVELIYGMNRFEIILYGPQGQVRREVHAVAVGLDSIPTGKTRYWFGVLDEGRDLIDFSDSVVDPRRQGWRAVAAVERGLDTKTGIGLFATTRRYDRRRYSALEAALRRTIGASIAELSLSWQSGGGRAARLYWTGALGRGTFQAESFWLGGGYVTDRLQDGATGFHSLSVTQPLRIGNMLLPTQFDARIRSFADGSQRYEANARVSANWRRLSLTTRVQWQRTVDREFSDRPDDVTAAILASVRLGRVRVRGEARLGIAGNARSSLALSADWRVADHTDWRAELGYDPHMRVGRGAVAYTRRFRQFAVTAQGAVGSDGSASAAVSLSFGFGPNPADGGVRFSRERLAAQGQAMAEVFRDDNGDGFRQANEELVEGVVLTAGNAVVNAPTGARGRAMIDALAPHRPVMIGIDESSLDDPLVRAAVPGVMIVPRPGVVTTVRLPLVATGEVEGTLIRANGLGIEGADLELVDSRGAVRATARSDFDGYFLFESVPYGNYQLRLSGEAAAVLRVSATLAQVVLSRANPRVRLGTQTPGAAPPPPVAPPPTVFAARQ